jgi:hypothetical protein
VLAGDVGFYFDTIPGAPGANASVACLPCPEGAECDEAGLTRDNLQTKPGTALRPSFTCCHPLRCMRVLNAVCGVLRAVAGYWRTNSSSVEYQRCLRASHCSGGSAECGANRMGVLCAQVGPKSKARTQTALLIAMV